MPDHLKQPTQYKRCKRYNEPGQAHVLTFSCFKRQPFLSKDRSRSWFLEALNRARTQHNLHVLAYVIIPEHVHLLIYPLDECYSISQILTDVKQPVTRQAIRYVCEHASDLIDKMKDEHQRSGVSYRFWQRGGGYDRNIVKPGTIYDEIASIHANPVRRGLAALPEE